MIEIGDTVTVMNDHIDISGNINLQSGKQMVVMNGIHIILKLLNKL